MILPLANARDKCTQIHWGMRDFEHRFGRIPRECGCRKPRSTCKRWRCWRSRASSSPFSLPYQAGRVRRSADAHGARSIGGRIDPPAYAVRLPSRTDDQRVLLRRSHFARRSRLRDCSPTAKILASACWAHFPTRATWPQLVHIATDGETYGHHHAYGEMALAYALELHRDRTSSPGSPITASTWRNIRRRRKCKSSRTAPGAASHGVERWRSDCGCNSGGHRDWNQQWRGAAAGGARLAARRRRPVLSREKPSSYFNNPWAARDEYIDVILDRPLRAGLASERACEAGTVARRKMSRL